MSKATGESKRAKLKNRLTEVREAHEREGRNYARLQYSIYTGYACESFLRAVSRSEYADKAALKGGTMLRVWNGNLARPTLDIDFQVLDDATAIDPARMRERLLDMITTADFAEETGVMVDRTKLVISTIKENELPGAYRIEGPVDIGGTQAVLCVEVSFGKAPSWLCEWGEVPSLVHRDPPVPEVLMTTRAWMAAEKLHAILWHGPNNTRFKDFYDLAYSLFPDAKLTSVNLRAALEFVVSNKASCGWPQTADSAIGLTAAFSTDEKEHIWQHKQWGNFEGRSFDATRDLTLAETCELIAAELEARELLARGPVAAAASALKSLEQAQTAPDAVAALFALNAQSATMPATRLEARYNAVRWQDGLGKLSLADALVAALEGLKGRGLTQEVSAQWEKSVGTPLKHTITRLAAYCEASKPNVQTAAAPDAATKNTPTPGLTEADVAQALEKMANRTNPALWPNALVTLVLAKEQGIVTDPLDIPEPALPMPVMTKAWVGVSKRHGITRPLDDVLADLRGDTPALRR
jgi:hypothetical protein